MSIHAIETEQPSKRFGDVLAVDSVNLCVQSGEIYGFPGLSGAGRCDYRLGRLVSMVNPLHSLVEPRVHRHVLVILTGISGLSAAFFGGVLPITLTNARIRSAIVFRRKRLYE